MEMSNLYKEDYDDQNGADFDFVAVDGQPPVAITDLEEQVNEFRRLYGKDVGITVYKDKGAPVCV